MRIGQNTWACQVKNLTLSVEAEGVQIGTDKPDHIMWPVGETGWPVREGQGLGLGL